MGCGVEPGGGQAATLRSLGVAVVAGARPTVHDLAGQDQDQGQGGGVIVRDEAGVGGHEDPTTA
jgi:hypothetical protein